MEIKVLLLAVALLAGLPAEPRPLNGVKPNELAAILQAANPAKPLTLTVDTSKPGSAANTFVLPLNGGYTGVYAQNVGTAVVTGTNLAYSPTYAFTYDCSVDWGDGAVQIVNNAVAGFPNVTHVYAAGGVYTVKITERSRNGFPTLNFNGGGDCKKVMSLTQWGTNVWVSMSQSFYGCSNMTMPATDLPLTRGVTDFQGAFRACSALTSFPAIDTSSAIIFMDTWAQCTGLTSFPALNTANVQSFWETWYSNTALTSFPLINTSKGLTFHSCWNSCPHLTGVFPALDFSKGTDFQYAWVGDNLLTTFASTDFSSAVIFGAAWSVCSGLTSFPAITCPNVVDFQADGSGLGAWQGCTGLTTFPALNVPLGVRFNNAWSGCTGLTSFGTLTANTSASTFVATWQNCTALTSFPAGSTLSGGTNFSGTWQNCTHLTSFPALNLSAGTIFSSAWQGCNLMTSFGAVSTSSGQNFTSAWNGCTGLTNYNFPTLDMHDMTVGTTCFNGWKMSTTAYDAMLNQLANGAGAIAANTHTSVTFHGGTATYDASAIAAHTLLTNTTGNGGRAWTITDGGTGTLALKLTVTSGVGMSFTLPLDGVSTYNAWVNWGDTANWQAITSNSPIAHSYPANATYTVQVLENAVGGFPTMKFNNGGSKTQVTAIAQWGINTWSTFNSAFYGCTALKITATDSATAATSAVTDWTSAFQGCTALTPMTVINTSGGTDFTNAWNGCTGLTAFPSLTMTGGQNFTSTWSGCNHLTTFPALNLSVGTNFSSAWLNCTALTSFNTVLTGAGTNFTSTWSGCTGLNAYNFPALDMHAMTNGTNCFNGWKMSTSAYDAILNQLANGAGAIAANTNTTVTFSGGTSTYDDTAYVGRNTTLVTGRSWTITDGGVIAPTVTGIAPALGTHLGGTSVTLTGTNFLGATSAKIGGVAVTSLVVVNSTTITCVTGAHAIGAVNVTVTTAGGTGTSASNIYTYN